MNLSSCQQKLKFNLIRTRRCRKNVTIWKCKLKKHRRWSWKTGYHSIMSFSKPRRNAKSSKTRYCNTRMKSSSSKLKSSSMQSFNRKRMRDKRLHRSCRFRRNLSSRVHQDLSWVIYKGMLTRNLASTSLCHFCKTEKFSKYRR